MSVIGSKTACISYCQISGSGTLDVQSGATVECSAQYNNDATTTCNSGTIRIRSGGTWKLSEYRSHKTHLSVKNLILDGSVTRDVSSDTLIVTGSITGNGTTPMLTMGANAVFKPTGTGYLNITQALSGKLKVDISDPALAGKVKIPLLKVPTALKDTADGAFDLTALSPDWELQSKESEGNVEYWIKSSGFSIFIR